MFYTYVIKNKEKSYWYTGSTKDLKLRIKQHNNGESTFTKSKGPFEVIYYEASINEDDARRRERYLKSGMGKRYVRNRLKSFFENPDNSIVSR